MPTFKIYPNNRVKPESAYLQKYQKNITSQCGEDGVIEKIFEIIGASNKWCVEFGAWDGKHFSNTWSLINQHGWKAVLIEGDKGKFKELVENCANNTGVITVNKFVDTVDGSNSLDFILSKTSIPNDFDFLCIDIDGCDWHVWRLLKQYRPRLVVIEFNPTIPNHVSFVQDNDLTINHGSSLRAMIELGWEKGYELIATTLGNAFFTRKEDFGKFGIEDNSIESMHSLDKFESTFFQLYDGTVMLGGCTQLLWHGGLPINFEDIQVLPRALRKFTG
jgi:hypothetical protein